jgi:hypothetical protein
MGLVRREMNMRGEERRGEVGGRSTWLFLFMTSRWTGKQ